MHAPIIFCTKFFLTFSIKNEQTYCCSSSMKEKSESLDLSR